MQLDMLNKKVQEFMLSRHWTPSDECSEVAEDLKSFLKAGTYITFIRPRDNAHITPFATEVNGVPSTHVLSEGLFDYHTVVVVTCSGVKYVIDPFKRTPITPLSIYVEDLRTVNNTADKFVYVRGVFDDCVVRWYEKLEKRKVKYAIV